MVGEEKETRVRGRVERERERKRGKERGGKRGRYIKRKGERPKFNSSEF